MLSAERSISPVSNYSKENRSLMTAAGRSETPSSSRNSNTLKRNPNSTVKKNIPLAKRVNTNKTPIFNIKDFIDNLNSTNWSDRNKALEEIFEEFKSGNEELDINKIFKHILKKTNDTHLKIIQLSFKIIEWLVKNKIDRIYNHLNEIYAIVNHIYQ